MCSCIIHMARKYSYIRTKLVEDDNDIVGHIAYSLYKKSKETYIEQWKAEHENADITETELNYFHKSIETKEVLDGFRAQAENIMKNFCDSMMNEVIPEIEQDAVDRHTEMMESAVKKLINKPWWMDIIIGVVSSLVFTALCALILYANEIGVI